MSVNGRTKTPIFFIFLFFFIYLLFFICFLPEFDKISNYDLYFGLSLRLTTEISCEPFKSLKLTKTRVTLFFVLYILENCLYVLLTVLHTYVMFYCS